jgi:hypothetical protein
MIFLRPFERRRIVKTPFVKGAAIGAAIAALALLATSALAGGVGVKAVLGKICKSCYSHSTTTFKYSSTITRHEAAGGAIESYTGTFRVKGARASKDGAAQNAGSIEIECFVSGNEIEGCLAGIDVLQNARTGLGAGGIAAIGVPPVFAILGGTGRYLGAAGQLRITGLPTEENAGKSQPAQRCCEMKISLA